MNIQPTKDNLLVEVPEVTEASGLTYTEMGQSTPVIGVIKKAGPESKFSEGQTVFFRRYAVDELKFMTDKGEEKLILVNDDDIVATKVEELPAK